MSPSSKDTPSLSLQTHHVYKHTKSLLSLPFLLDGGGLGAAVGAAGRGLVSGVEVIDAGSLLVTVLMGGLDVLVIRVSPHLTRDHRVSAAALLIITSSMTSS